MRSRRCENECPWHLSLPVPRQLSPRLPRWEFGPRRSSFRGLTCPLCGSEQVMPAKVSCIRCRLRGTGGQRAEGWTIPDPVDPWVGGWDGTRGEANIQFRRISVRGEEGGKVLETVAGFPPPSSPGGRARWSTPAASARGLTRGPPERRR